MEPFDLFDEINNMRQVLEKNGLTISKEVLQSLDKDDPLEEKVPRSEIVEKLSSQNENLWWGS